MEGTDAARAIMGAATAVEKKAFDLFALLSALRERRCTPREVSMVDDVDSQVGRVSGGESFNNRHVGE